MNKALNWFIIGIILGLVFGCVGGYFYARNTPTGNLGNPNFNRMQVDESKMFEVTSLFNSESNQEEIENYCDENMNACFYYCRQINPENNLCKILINSSREGMLSKR